MDLCLCGVGYRTSLADIELVVHDPVSEMDNARLKTSPFDLGDDEGQDDTALCSLVFEIVLT